MMKYPRSWDVYRGKGDVADNKVLFVVRMLAIGDTENGEQSLVFELIYVHR